MIDNFETKTTCPLCRTDMVIKWQKDTIPYFGDIMFTTGVCDSCTFRFSDTLILNGKDPVCYSLPIRSLSDLDARVIRSSSGTIIIEELGIMVEPGTISESYVSNAEGVLQRIRGVVESAVRWSEGDEEKIERGTELLRQIDEIIDNPTTASLEITLQIKDPLGNSAILSAGATSRKLTPEELESLKTGMIVLDVEKEEIIHDISDDAGPLGNKML
ncbi:MAG: ZPR1 zinc finger domain-containing protein [Methanimicrococcus sp.]|nr:ZPR1 zinc finger domain-containing protein [Methanimicrococcus sp.]